MIRERLKQPYDQELVRMYFRSCACHRRWFSVRIKVLTTEVFIVLRARSGAAVFATIFMDDLGVVQRYHDGC
jgi:hypothetical protein